MIWYECATLHHQKIILIKSDQAGATALYNDLIYFKIFCMSTKFVISSFICLIWIHKCYFISYIYNDVDFESLKKWLILPLPTYRFLKLMYHKFAFLRHQITRNYSTPRSNMGTVLRIGTMQLLLRFTALSLTTKRKVFPLFRSSRSEGAKRPF